MTLSNLFHRGGKGIVDRDKLREVEVLSEEVRKRCLTAIEVSQLRLEKALKGIDDRNADTTEDS